MIVLLSISVLILIVCVAFLFWYTHQLHDLLTKALYLIEDNANLIRGVQRLSYEGLCGCNKLIKSHLELNHGWKESEETKNE